MPKPALEGSDQNRLESSWSGQVHPEQRDPAFSHISKAEQIKGAFLLPVECIIPELLNVYNRSKQHKS